MTKLLVIFADDSVGVIGYFGDPEVAINQQITGWQNNLDKLGAQSSFYGRLPIKSYREVEDSELPERIPGRRESDYRDSWRYVDGQVKHDMAAARDIHKDYLRRERVAQLEALDVAYQRADEDGDAKRKQDIVQAKQTLRDITDDPRLAAAATIDDLRVVTIPPPLDLVNKDGIVADAIETLEGDKT